MKHILTLCIGNICRSPIAEALLRQQFPERTIWSAGLGALVGNPADLLAVEVAAAHGTDLSAHRAQQLVGWMCQTAELILVMEQDHKTRIEQQYPPDMGGIESVTASLALGAAAAGHQVTVVCFSKARAQEPERLPSGVKVLRATVTLLKASQPLGWRYWRLALREGCAADVVHLHAPNMLAALAGVLLGRGPKLVVHWHSDLVGKGWLGWALKPLETALLRRADKVVCTSQAYADASPTLKLFVDKVVVVPIGVADSAAVNGDSRCEGLPEVLQARLLGRRVVLAVGRLVPYKGFHVLVEAAPRLPPDVVVVIVGTGPLHTDLQAQIDATCTAEQVVLAGRQSDAALRTLFQRAVLFCLPSVERSEAFGVVLIEAMSHRLPVVATQITGSGVPWVNAQGVSGLNVPVNDAAALAAACNQILSSDGLRLELATGARMRFEREFTEQVSINRMLAVYGSLLNKGEAA